MKSEDAAQLYNSSSVRKHLKNYGLLNALLKRRSRRFSRGMEIESGPTEYSSKKELYPLSEEEQAILALSAGKSQ